MKGNLTEHLFLTRFNGNFCFIYFHVKVEYFIQQNLFNKIYSSVIKDRQTIIVWVR